MAAAPAVNTRSAEVGTREEDTRDPEQWPEPDGLEPPPEMIHGLFIPCRCDAHKAESIIIIYYYIDGKWWTSTRPRLTHW